MKYKIKQLLRLFKDSILRDRLSSHAERDATSDLNFLLSLAETSQGTFISVVNLNTKVNSAVLPAIVIRVHIDKGTTYLHGFLVHLKDLKRTFSHEPVVRAVLFTLRDKLLVTEFSVEETYRHLDIGRAVIQYFNQLAYLRQLKCVSVERKAIPKTFLSVFEEQGASISAA